MSFCFKYHVVSPFPVSECMLCYFDVSLAREGLAHSTIKTYLAAVRHTDTHIERGYPDLRDGTSLPQLHLVQTGIHHDRAEQGPPVTQRLPITVPLLRQMRRVLTQHPIDYESSLIWVAATTCFFFRSGEITAPTESGFNPTVHLAWGDVGMDDSTPSTKIRVVLKRSKTYQFGRGVAVWIGETRDEVCPVRAVMGTQHAVGQQLPSFVLRMGSP